MGKDILFEIGLEELPARFIDDAEKQLRTKTKQWFEENRISYQRITSYSTPRRLAVLIEQAVEEQETVEEEVKGPSLKVAQTEDGAWSKAAVGFTKGQGMTVDDIYTKEVKGVSYIYVKKRIDGKKTKELLPSFKEIIEGIQFGKNMRWSTESLRYARPIRWLVALYGEEIIPFEIASVPTDRITYGHRFLGKKVSLNNPKDYENVMEKQYVIVNAEDRKKRILDSIRDLEINHDVVIPVDDSLLHEVCNLVEYPTAFVGSFDERFLNLPEEVLITSMKEHQRYFPVKTKEGQLLPKFIGVRNGNDKKLDTVVKGNEKVLRARLSDAEFFFEEDLKKPIDYYVERLEKVVFQEKLGTYMEKVKRVQSIAVQTASLINQESSFLQKTERAAMISKFDLMTNMVQEFTELQGIIGEKYAAIYGEEDDIAASIREHYMPINANGKLPDTMLGSILSVADKMDTVVGCISVGLIPTGSQDPYGLRRQATGILRILEENNWDISLETILEIALQQYQDNKYIENTEDVKKSLHEFFQQRATFILREKQIEQDVIHAVLDKEIGLFNYAEEKALLLSQKRHDSDFKRTQEALVRVLNIAKKTEETEVDTDYLQTESERALFRTYLEAKENYDEGKREKNANKALQALTELTEPIHAFFDHNMVMAEDENLKRNRLALLNRIAKLTNDFANLSIIEWKQHQ